MSPPTIPHSYPPEVARPPYTAKDTPVTADGVALFDSEDSYRRKWLPFSKLFELVFGIQTLKRHDWVAPYSYCGQAPSGSAESAAVWTIARIEVAADGTTTVTHATAVAWTDRLTAEYT